LARRSENILHRLTGRSEDDIRNALRHANGNVKLAVLLLHGCDVDRATAVLDRAGGRLRTALEDIGRSPAEPPPEADDILSLAEELVSPVGHDE
jgi:N-acetylmuramic acid 6-phosphate etherase